jgi:hypothetical protein
MLAYSVVTTIAVSSRGADPGPERYGMMRRTMAPRLLELVGRAMIDPEFLADLQRSPATVLAQFELSDAERAAIDRALRRLADAPPRQRAEVLRTALLRRVAT